MANIYPTVKKDTKSDLYMNTIIIFLTSQDKDKQLARGHGVFALVPGKGKQSEHANTTERKKPTRDVGNPGAVSQFPAASYADAGPELAPD